MPVAIKIGGYQPPASVHSRAVGLFAENLRARLGEAVEVEVEPNVVERGHNAADLLDMVASGALTVCYFSTSYLTKWVPAMALLDVPFLHAERAALFAALDGAAGAVLADRLVAAAGLRPLAYWDNGFRHLTNRARPLRRPADCRGLRIRTLDSSVHQSVFQRLGFEPVVLDVKDLGPAVAAGTVDAQENPLTSTFNFGIHEHHRFVTLSGHVLGVAALLCNAAIDDGWPAAVRDAVRAAAAEVTTAQRAMAAAEDAAILERLGPETEITRLDATDLAAFRAAVAPVVEDLRRRHGGDPALAQLSGSADPWI